MSRRQLLDSSTINLATTVDSFAVRNSHKSHGSDYPYAATLRLLSYLEGESTAYVWMDWNLAAASLGYRPGFQAISGSGIFFNRAAERSEAHASQPLGIDGYGMVRYGGGNSITGGCMNLSRFSEVGTRISVR